VHAGDVLQERIRVTDAQGDVEEHLPSRHATWPAPRLPHKQPHLFVTGTTKALLIGSFSDGSTDLGGSVRLPSEPVDLVPKPKRDSRCEEAHAKDGAERNVTSLPRLSAETVTW
jgi:hypothetical protein